MPVIYLKGTSKNKETTMNNKVIGLAADHAGYEKKELVAGYLMANGYAIKDYGAHSPERSDYPDFAHFLAKGIENGECYTGFAFCGTANGMAITLNKYPDIRAAICWSEEISALARKHNDANVCCIPARFLEDKAVCDIVDIFLSEKFEGGRHQARIEKIPVKK